jgi:hypothetical protein
MIALFVLVITATVGTGFAKEKEDEMKGRGHNLIDHRRVEAMRHHHDQGSGQQSASAGSTAALETQVTDLLFKTRFLL